MDKTRRRAPRVPGGRIRVPVRLDAEQYSKLAALQAADGEPAAAVLIRGLEALWEREAGKVGG